MNVAELSGLLTAIGVLLTAVATVINIGVSLRNGRKIKEVHDATNGMKTELVKEVREASFARGVKSETDKK